MALTFPSSPTNGQVYTDTVTGNRYIYDSSKSLWKFSSNNVGVSVSSTPPGNVAPGAIWYNREIGRTFVYYDDGDSKQWVETVPATGTFDSTMVSSYANTSATLAVAPAYNTANAGYGKANNALANTSGTFAGDLVTTGKIDARGSSTYLINPSLPTSWISTDTALTSNSMYSQFNTTSSVGIMGTYTNHPLTFVTNNSERVRIASDGKVGIGTNSPQANVHIFAAGGPDINQGTLQIAANTANSDNVNVVGAGITFSQKWWYGSPDLVRVAGIYGVKGVASGNFGGALAFYTQPLGGDPMVERMRIDSSGRLNTTQPTCASKKFLTAQSNFDNPATPLVTVTRVGTNQSVTIKVRVIQNVYAAATGNEHIGIGSAYWTGSAWSTAASSMSVTVQNTITNVGTLSWSTSGTNTTLNYTSNRSGNYDAYFIEIDFVNNSQLPYTLG